MEYYIVVNWKKLLVHAARWVNSKNNDEQKKSDIKENIYTNLYKVLNVRK